MNAPDSQPNGSSLATLPADAPVIALHKIPSPLVVLDPGVTKQVRDLSRKGRALEVSDLDSFKRADDVNLQMRTLRKQIEDHREAAKRPVLELGRAIDAAAREAMAPLDEASGLLSVRVLDFKRAQDKIRREAEDAEHKRKADEAEAEKKRRLAEIIGTPAGQPSAAPAEVPAVAQAPIFVPPPLKAASVHTVTRKALRIVDIDKVPHSIQVGSATKVLWTLDEAACLKLLLGDVPIPGLELAEVEGLATGRGVKS